MYLLIQRTPDVPPKFNNYRFETFDQAVWKARESNHDYLIQREANGVMPGMPITYRIGPYELD